MQYLVKGMKIMIFLEMVVAILALTIGEMRVEAAEAILEEQPAVVAPLWSSIPVQEAVNKKLEEELKEMSAQASEEAVFETGEVIQETIETEELPESVVLTTEEPVVQPEVVEKTYTTADVQLLGQIMYAEEGVFIGLHYNSEPEKVERVFKLCGSVVLHRVEAHLLGEKNINDVLYAKDQYAYETKQRVQKYQKNPGEVPQMVYKWAEDLLRDGAIGPKGLIFQAQFQQGQFYEQIWNQIFGVANL